MHQKFQDLLVRIITDALLSDPPDFDTISNVLKKGQFDGATLRKIASLAIKPCIDYHLVYDENDQYVPFVDRSARMPAFLSLMLENGMSPNVLFDGWNIIIRYLSRRNKDEKNLY